MSVTAKERRQLTAELRLMDRMVDRLRTRLQIHAPFEDFWSDCLDGYETYLFATPDGYGKARVVHAKGNYPIDYIVINERQCITEDEALRLCEIYEFADDKDEALDKIFNE